MQFESTHINGKGRGKPMGFPTINLNIPKDFKLKDGVYAVKVNIESKTFVGAMHYGSIPTFSEQEKNLEIYLIGIKNIDLENYGLSNLEGKNIKVEIIKYLRGTIKFRTVAGLVKQIDEDVKQIKAISPLSN